MKVRTILLQAAATLVLLALCTSGSEAAADKKDRPLRSRQEQRADRCFIKGDYRRAMKTYEKVNDALEENDTRKSALELKMARLYTSLQQPEDAIRCYERVYDSARETLTVSDICFFIDALRQNGQQQKAEIIVRSVAFKNVFSRNQRYLNTLNSLSNQQHYYAKGKDPCSVELVGKSGDLPEYWVGKWDGKLFYAVSHSALQDPFKIYYHRTQYFSLDDKAELPFKAIPRELQSGPVSFSDNGRMMVATGISYRNSGRIVAPVGDQGMYVTQLYYSLINEKSGGWSRFQPLFDYQEGYSYAHPTFFDGGRSLVFASDRPGGYGGMDLYIATWNETAGKWGDPVNLGGGVNTEGDEIYPRIIDDRLYFSSNGHEGFGGYDIYRMSFDGGIVLPGTFYHYPYPVNTTYNDFGLMLDGDDGYLISDRRGVTGREDVYKFNNVVLSLGRDDFDGISDEFSAMKGNLNLITGLKASNTEQFNKSLKTLPQPQPGDVLLSVYFDFNSHSLDAESTAILRRFVSDPAATQSAELSIIGYADEFGTWQYNKRLSEDRARAVAGFLRQNRIAPELFTEGRGQIRLSEEEYKAALQRYTTLRLNAEGELNQSGAAPSVEDKIRINRFARRVDIVVREK